VRLAYSPCGSSMSKHEIVGQGQARISDRRMTYQNEQEEESRLQEAQSDLSTWDHHPRLLAKLFLQTSHTSASNAQLDTLALTIGFFLGFREPDFCLPSAVATGAVGVAVSVMKEDASMFSVSSSDATISWD
jgi:hypothetical protein